MHGRLKIRTSAEEAARKKKAQELKVKAYRAGMAKIYQKRYSKELDDEMLQITGQILLKNPDIYTLWNIRKECILEKQKELDNEKIQTLFDKDLNFTEQCLVANPKSYGSWYHRCWIMENCPKPNWEREMLLCTKFLKSDERNFLCWDYRRFVVGKARIPLEKELEFCTEKIRNNFSNYSSWHYRSKLLHTLYPHETDKSKPINEQNLKSELEMVLTAAFTDPNDSSAWFYQRWLLGYSQPALNIAACRISPNVAVISFTKHVNLKTYKIYTNCGLLLENSEWEPANKENIYDITWVLKKKIDLSNIKSTFIITCESENHEIFEIELFLTLSKDFFGFKCPKFEYEFGDGVIEELKNQLNSCDQLLEFEPDNKWTLLTASLLMRAIDRKKYHTKCLEYLKKLEKIDYLRKGYYEDLSSKWIIEKCIEDCSKDNKFPQTFSLCGKGLTTICHEQYLSIVNEIDLSENFLTNRIIPKFKVFQFCEVLNLSSNKIATIIEDEKLLYNFKNLKIHW